MMTVEQAQQWVREVYAERKAYGTSVREAVALVVPEEWQALFLCAILPGYCELTDWAKVPAA